MNRILAFSDHADTGFGRVSKEILSGINASDNYEVCQLGINYYGDPHGMNYPIWPMDAGDPYGRGKLFSTLQKTDPDIFFTINDVWALEWMVPVLNAYRQRAGKRVPWVAYIPIDGTPLKEDWLKVVRGLVDKPVTYTKWAQDVLKSAGGVDVPFIYHGVDTEVFKPRIDRSMKNESLKQLEEQIKREVNFVVGYVGRNQQRKRIPELMLAYKQFAKDKDDVLLYFHAPSPDAGWDIGSLRATLGIDESYVAKTSIASINNNYPDNQLVAIYNMFDMIALPTVGEGFGLTLVEGMATGCVPMVTDFGASKEIRGEAGYGVEIGSYTFLAKDNEVLRPIPSVSSMVSAMEHAYNDKKNHPSSWVQMINESVDRAKMFSSWNVDKWLGVFDDVVEEMNSVGDSELEFIYE